MSGRGNRDCCVGVRGVGDGFGAWIWLFGEEFLTFWDVFLGMLMDR
ncbi:hypothetical protein FF011L_21960 [Roseimaritima multifibrata]|uniref:Uncharacterized protein n=1 Tax=Roseimaritima multifibrata TaxID=1930274 RepID=A0A517MEZ7_9BACT|nr:hypothetical protein FF011L_21960 [Roseimaritima multifibrata]